MTKKQIEYKKLSQTGKVSNFHHNDNLVFTAIDNTIIRGLANKLSIHKSSGSYGSEYFLAEIAGKTAYVRISNHWGRFYTTERGPEGAYSKAHNWDLIGSNVTKKDGTYKSVKMAGFIYL